MVYQITQCKNWNFAWVSYVKVIFENGKPVAVGYYVTKLSSNRCTVSLEAIFYHCNKLVDAVNNMKTIFVVMP